MLVSLQTSGTLRWSVSEKKKGLSAEDVEVQGTVPQVKSGYTSLQPLSTKRRLRKVELPRLRWTSVWESERTFSLQKLFPDFGFLISKQKSTGHKERGPRALRKYFAVVGWKCDDGNVVAHFKHSD